MLLKPIDDHTGADPFARNLRVKFARLALAPYAYGGVLWSHFGLDVPKDVMDALDRMRLKVNIMKHKGGVQDDELVSATDYGAAVATIERFWEFLVEKEQTRLRRP